VNSYDRMLRDIVKGVILRVSIPVIQDDRASINARGVLAGRVQGSGVDELGAAAPPKRRTFVAAYPSLDRQPSCM
jgi:hypothetical protein